MYLDNLAVSLILTFICILLTSWYFVYEVCTGNFGENRDLDRGLDESAYTPKELRDYMEDATKSEDARQKESEADEAA